MSTPSDITKAAEELADSILKAAGSGLRHYTVQKTRDEIIGAAVKGLQAEREKNAKIADEQAADWLQGVKKARSLEMLNYANGRQDGAVTIAAAIRKGEVA